MPIAIHMPFNRIFFWKCILITLFSIPLKINGNENKVPVTQNFNQQKEMELSLAKAFVLEKMIEPSDNLFERRVKSLVSNFLVNSVAGTGKRQVATTIDDTFDYYDDGPTTTQKVFTWPSFFATEASTTPLSITSNPSSTQSIDDGLMKDVSTNNESLVTTTSKTISSNFTTTESPTLTTEEPVNPDRIPSGLIGAVQHLTSIVPDAIRIGGNNTSILNKASVSSILKILGSVAFLNLSGIIDNSIELGTSNPVRDIVFGVTNLVFCNPVVLQLNSGRCTRMLSQGESFEHFLGYDNKIEN